MKKRCVYTSFFYNIYIFFNIFGYKYIFIIQNASTLIGNNQRFQDYIKVHNDFRKIGK